MRAVFHTKENKWQLNYTWLPTWIGMNKSLMKELLWYLTCVHQQGPEPNILLFATRRGGSTFLMELIAANRGIRSIDQPFEMTAAFPTAAQVADMPLFEDGQMTSLDERSARRLHALTERIFAGEVVINAPIRVWRRSHTGAIPSSRRGFLLRHRRLCRPR